MNRDAIINQFVKDPDYRAMCQQLTGDRVAADDLYQELALFVLELPDNKLARLNETCLKCFFYRMAQKQFNSKNSVYHKKYRKEAIVVRNHREDILQAQQSTLPDDRLIGKVKKVLSDAYWYDAGIMELYAEHGTLQKVSSLTGIPIASIHDTVSTVRKMVRRKIKKNE